MVTLQERQKERQAKFKAKFKAQKKKRSTTLSRVAEITAQRRGRGFDPLETVIKQAVVPPPPPKPKKPTSICDVLGTTPGFKRGQTVARGVSFGCGSQPLAFNSQMNNTTVRFFGAQIASNQAKIRAAGLGHLIPANAAEKSNAQRAIKIARKKKNFALVARLQLSACGGTKAKPTKNLGIISGQKCSSIRRQAELGFF